LHCYSSSSADRRHDELTTSEAKQLFSGLAESGCPVVLFSGGEPLLREDLFELLIEASQLGLRTVLSTNGTLIDKACAGELAASGVSYVGVSVDGGQQFHDKFRGVTGSFKSAVAGIENCQKVGIRTGLRFTIMKANFEQITSVFDIAVSVGVRRLCFYHLIRSGRAKELEEQTLAAEQTRRAVDMIIETTDEFVGKNLLDEVLTVDNHADGPYLLVKMASRNNKRLQNARQLLLANGGNKIGEGIVCVSWDGNVYPDQFWRNFSLGNIRDKTFREIWEDSSQPVLKKLRNKSGFADKRCVGCRWFDLCKGNFRFLGSKADNKYWLNEPACYLMEEEITD